VDDFSWEIPVTECLEQQISTSAESSALNTREQNEKEPFKTFSFFPLPLLKASLIDDVIFQYEKWRPGTQESRFLTPFFFL